MDVYRLQAKRLREIGKTIGSECDVFCDEFMSVITLYYLQKMIVRIQRESSKNILLSLWESENRYRKEHHQESFSEQISQEQQLYRWRLLTKYVSSCLFLNIKPHVGPTFLVHSLYGFAAAVSMIFATVIAFAWQGQYGALSANLFVALVIGYIFKDRIKDLLKEQILLLRSLQKDPYPIGSLYMTTKQDNPSTYFGGKWTLYKILDKKDGDDYIFKRIE